MDIGYALLDYLSATIGRDGISCSPGAFACTHSISSVVGRQIDYFRHRMKMTQQELAEKLNVDPSTISRHERGENLKLEHLTDYAKVFGINEYDLITIDHDDSDFSKTIRQFQLLHNLTDSELSEALDAVEAILRLGKNEE